MLQLTIIHLKCSQKKRVKRAIIESDSDNSQ